MRSGVVLRRVLLAVLGLAMPVLAAEPAIVPARDLAADGAESARSGRPLVILFTATWCEYCAALKRDYFEHAARDPAFTARVILREVSIDSGTALVDFDRRSASHAALAARRGVDFVPAVHFADGSGETLAAPLVGVRIPDWYGVYLERRIGVATRALLGRHAEGGGVPERRARQPAASIPSG